MIPWLKKFKFIFLWLFLTAAIGGYCYYLFFEAEDKTALLPGTTTDGHHQIEMQCSACHTDEEKENVFTSSGVPNSACMNCHSEALEKFSDSHPVRKFKNPENAIFLEHVDAMQCISCHGEHNQKITGEMAVTIPSDYCAHCHEVTLENLDSHKDLAYDSCATAGCHNYHDNTPLAPSYLIKHYGESKMLEKPGIPELASTEKCTDPWAPGTTAQSCAKCHDEHFHTFKQGKHGMRLAFEGLSPMTPAMARIPTKQSAAHLQMDCMACHQPNKPRTFSAYESCLQCHDDEHTRNYKNSPHFTHWQAKPGESTSVSCATCHMPRIENEDGDYTVSHDNTANLTPNEKMIRSSCINCHGLQFSMNALADKKLIQANFNTTSTMIHPGIEWTADSAIKRGDKKIEAIRDYLKKSLSNTETKN